MEKRPVLAITMGDPAGVGAEIIVKAILGHPLYKNCIPVVIGDGAVLDSTAKMLGVPFSMRRISEPEEANGEPGVIECIDLQMMDGKQWAMGQVSADCGGAAFEYVKRGIELAMKGSVDAVVTAPLNKEAMNLAGYHYAGHTEIFAKLTGTADYAMMLSAGPLRVIHVTTHQSLHSACESVKRERVLTVIRLARRAADMLGLHGKIAVAGLNPHCSENGLFGTDEQEEIIPAILDAGAEGIQAEGPIPPDTVFVKAAQGQYDMVVAMYHDQGHIPVKMMGFSLGGGKASVAGVNCTIGLPIIRTSVDHGTAFDLAGKGMADETSMVDAIAMAVQMSHGRGKV